MSYGRWGRGRGHGQYRLPPSKEEDYILFPDIKELPECGHVQKEELKALTLWSNSLQKFWISSPYYYESMDEHSQRNGGIIGKPLLSDYMKVTDDYVPTELGVKNVRHRNKTIRWDPQSDIQRLDILEKLDEKPQGHDHEKEKKEDEDEDEDDENVEDEREDSGNDYEQNFGFDDDEDDFNMPVDYDKEGYY